jgi:reactive intermediate/imine deaminase
MIRDLIYSKTAPTAIGTYSQGLRVGNVLYLSGQIPLDPATQELVEGDVETQLRRVFDNLSAVAEAGGVRLMDAVKLTIYLTDLEDFAAVNEVMKKYFREPYPARAVVGVAALPKGARVEADAIVALK